MLMMFLVFRQTTDWEGGGHAIGGAWLELGGRIGSTALLFLFVFLIVRALVRRHRYRAVDVLSAEDQKLVHTELVAAEKRTVGEIVPVVVERSDRHPGASWLAATSTLLLGSALLAPWMPWDRPALLLICQIALGALGYGLTWLLPDFKRVFIRESRATEMAVEQALQEFYRYHLHRTEAKTGVLLFVSLLEHRVVVLADEGIDAKVLPEDWKETDAAILEGIVEGSLRDGVIAGIRKAADLLEQHFPWVKGDRNEVPDRLIIRRD